MNAHAPAPKGAKSTTGPSRARLAWLPALALALGALGSLTPLHEQLSHALRDASLRWTARDDSYRDVVVVDIGDASLRALKPRLGNWPYRRDVFALTIDYLRETGAGLIVFDFVFDTARAGDDTLSRAVARGPDVVLAAAGLKQPIETDAPPSVHLARVSYAADARAATTRWPALTLPTDALLAACLRPGSVGLISVPLDNDGVLRQLPLLHESAGRVVPSLPLAALVLARADASAARPLDDAPSLAHAWPVDGRGRATLMLPKNRDAVPILRFDTLMSDVLGQSDGQATRAAVGGRTVFIGSSAFLGDEVMTPLGRLPGTLLLATAYGALARGQVLDVAGWPAQGLLLAVALLPACLTWRRGRAAVLGDAAAAALALAVVVGGSVAALPLLKLQADPQLAISVTGFGFVLAAFAQLRWTQLANRRLAHERALAESANWAKSDFLASVGHELRTPLNALLGMAELLSKTHLAPEQRRYVSVFRSAGNRLFALINDLLDLSKIEAGKIELHESVFSLRQLLADQVALLQPRAAEKGLQIVLECPSEVEDMLRADPERLAQVLVNLVGNALKFTRAGQVRIAVRRVGMLLQFSVSDSGVGIAPGKLDLIFEPFTQADDSVHRTFGGTGLGLSISKRLVELMGGRIWVESTLGQGSTFHFTVQAPAQVIAAPPPAAAQEQRSPGEFASTRPGGCSILLAEDNETNIVVFEAMLQPAGHVVDVAPNGEVAIRKYSNGRYDLVLMDVQMPVLDGLAATRAIRDIESAQGRPHTPVVALTAEASEDDAQRSVAAGCDAHLSKPISQASLLEAIDRVVAARR